MANSKRTANRHMAHREAGHVEKGYRGGGSSTMSHGSPASKGASTGGGPMPGAGMTPAVGPGMAASRYLGMDKGSYPSRPTPPGTAPRGMQTYNQE